MLVELDLWVLVSESEFFSKAWMDNRASSDVFVAPIDVEHAVESSYRLISSLAGIAKQCIESDNLDTFAAVDFDSILGVITAAELATNGVEIDGSSERGPVLARVQVRSPKASQQASLSPEVVVRRQST